MGLLVYGKILTHHWKGNKVDVQALRGRILFRSNPPDGISREQKLAAAEKYFWCARWSMGNILVFIEEELG